MPMYRQKEIYFFVTKNDNKQFSLETHFSIPVYNLIVTPRKNNRALRQKTNIALVKNSIRTPFLLVLRHVDPVEVAVPGEAADLEVGAVPVVVLHGAVVDDVDYGDDEGAGLVLGALEEGL